ncbi:MAG: hypothetical protein ACOY3Y_20080 [Acidobacteriota bacterium]
MNRMLLADEWGISPAPHLGDTYFTCALAEAFLRAHGGRRVLVIVPPRLFPLLSLFPAGRIDPVDPATVEVPFRQGLGFRPGEPFHLRPVMHLGHFSTVYRGREVPFTQTYHDLLELPFPSFARPQVGPEIRAAAARRLEAAGLPRGRTVVLFPLSFSLTSFPVSLWTAIAGRFAERGLAVATNVAAEGDFCLPGTAPLVIPVDELIPICELAGTAVAARSGVCDVLSSARVDLRILYQRPEWEWRPMPGVALQWDLAACGLDDAATYFRMGSAEAPASFVDRVVERAP